jgi:hypothetical protein
MKITNKSKKLISFFNKFNCVSHINQTKATDTIFKHFFNEINEAMNFVSYTKKQIGHQSFYNLKLNKIEHINQIPRPSTFNADAFPQPVRTHIDEYSLNSLTYSLKLFERNIIIHFIIEEDNPEMYINKYNSYVDHILVWLYIINDYASHSCSKTLTIFIYHTSLTKTLPYSPIEILNENNVNTAFTRTCLKNAEIVVYRKEEWFKVLMHESFHNFALDFSDMDTSYCHARILSIFPVSSKVNLFEAYTEFWARIMNVIFCSYFNCKNKNDLNEFLSNTEYFIHFEINYSFFQLIKVLEFMNIEYMNLYEKTDVSANLRSTLYKEDTNVLSYYVITAIMIYNYQSFLQWSKTNNTSMLQFKKTNANLKSFCDFIEKKYKTPKLLEMIDCSETFFKKINNTNFKSNNKSNNKTNNDKIDELQFLTNNLRMTICEMG